MLIAGVFSCVSSDLCAEEAIPGPVFGLVTEVVDGDTVRVVAQVWLDQNVEVLVRIRGIDAPERYGECDAERVAAAEARAALEAALDEPEVRLVEIEGDKYFGRVVADVLTSEGHSLGEYMVASGWARVYSGGRREPWCTLTGQLHAPLP
jgi:endonuclease YncB( thermonuclease family)